MNADWDADEPTPDHVYDRRAEEAIVQDQLERGIRCF
jgi:hypothetical protein